MRCNLNCPFGEPRCCRACANGQKDLKDKFPDKWDDRHGFNSSQGCRIGENRPQRCKDYDCKDYVHWSLMFFKNGQWNAIVVNEVKYEEAVKLFKDKLNEDS